MLSERPYPFVGIGVVGLCVALFVLDAVIAIAAIRYGSVPLSTADVIQVLSDRFSGIGAANVVDDQIVWDLRLPRIITAILVGVALTLSGATLQTLIRNPIADPYILGAGPGASVGAVIVMLVAAPVGFAQVGVPLAAFLGAMLALVVVVLLGRRNGVLSPTRMVLAGVVVGYLCNSLTNYLQLRANPARLNGVLHWLLGSLSGSGWEGLLPPSVIILLATVWVFGLSRQLNALSFGEETASNLGINVGRTRLVLLVLSSLLTGSSVALAGGVAFIGLLVPHIARLLVGPSHQRLLPVAALFGSGLLMLVDLISRTVNAPNEMPLSIFTAALGGPFFLWLLQKEH